MPRVSREEKAKSHQRIIVAASRLFCERGIEGTSVSDIMEEAGLTHGGFYRHFASKDALIAAALPEKLDMLLNPITRADTPDKKRKALVAYIQRYLSSYHIANPADGCPIATLASELPRNSEPVRGAVAEMMNKFVDVIASAVPKPEAAEEIARTLAGAFVVARLEIDPQRQRGILSAAQKKVMGIVEGNTTQA